MNMQFLKREGYLQQIAAWIGKPVIKAILKIYRIAGFAKKHIGLSVLFEKCFACKSS